MCLIIVAPPGRTPTVDDLLDAIDNNPHGSGWAMRTSSAHVQSMRAASTQASQRLVTDFLAARKANPQTWALWHSRIATHGTRDDMRCHPFDVAGRPWKLAHNGMLPLSDPPKPGKFYSQRSDSQILAEDIISQFTWKDIRAMKDDWEDYLEDSKVVLLSSEREKGGPVLILNEALGHWIDGLWFSHMPYGLSNRWDRWDETTDLTWNSSTKTYEVPDWAAVDRMPS